MAPTTPTVPNSAPSDNNTQGQDTAPTISAPMAEHGADWEDVDSPTIEGEIQDDDYASEDTEVPEQPNSGFSNSSSEYSDRDASEGPFRPDDDDEDEGTPVLGGVHEDGNQALEAGSDDGILDRIRGYRTEEGSREERSRSFLVYRDEDHSQEQGNNGTAEDALRSFQSIVGVHPHAVEEEAEQEEEEEEPNTPPSKPRRSVKFSPRTKRRIEEETARGFDYNHRPTRRFFDGDNGEQVWLTEDGRVWSSRPPRHDGSTGRESGRKKPASPLSPDLSPVPEGSSFNDDVDDLDLDGSGVDDLPARPATPAPAQVGSTEEGDDDTPEHTSHAGQHDGEAVSFEGSTSTFDASKPVTTTEDEESLRNALAGLDESKTATYSFEDLSKISGSSKKTSWAADDDDEEFGAALSRISTASSSNNESNRAFSSNGVSYVAPGTDSSEDEDEPFERIDPAELAARLESDSTEFTLLTPANGYYIGEDLDELDEDSSLGLRPQPEPATPNSPMRQDYGTQTGPDSPEADSPQSASSLEVLQQATGLENEASARQYGDELNREIARIDRTRSESREDAGKRLRLKRAVMNIDEEELHYYGRLNKSRRIKLPEDPVEMMQFLRIRAWNYRSERDAWKRKYEESERWRQADNDRWGRENYQLQIDLEDSRDAVRCRNDEIADLRRKLKIAEEDLKWAKSECGEDGAKTKTEMEDGDESCEGKCRALEQQLQEQKRKTRQAEAEKDDFINETEKLMLEQVEAIQKAQKESSEQHKRLKETERLLQLAHLEIIEEQKKRKEADKQLAEVGVATTDAATQTEKLEQALEQLQNDIPEEFCNIKEHAKFMLDNPNLTSFADNKVVEAYRLDEKIWALEEKVKELQKRSYVDQETQTESPLLAEVLKRPVYVDAGFSAEDEALFPANVAYEEKIANLNDEVFELKKKVRTFRDASRERDVIEETGELEREQKGYKNRTTQTDGSAGDQELQQSLDKCQETVRGMSQMEERYRAKIMDLEHELDTKERELKECREGGGKKKSPPRSLSPFTAGLGLNTGVPSFPSQTASIDLVIPRSPLPSPASPKPPIWEAREARWMGSTTYQHAMARFEQRRQEREREQRQYDSVRNAAIENLLGRKPRAMSKEESYLLYQRVNGMKFGKKRKDDGVDE